MRTPQAGRWLPLAVAAVVSIAGCRPSFSLDRRDGGIAPGPSARDAAAPSPLDPAQCVGSPTACADRDAAHCIAGCAQRGCRGTPPSCGGLGRSSCLATAGCAWTVGDLYDECVGAPSGACIEYTTRDACGAAGCWWDSSAPCEGEPHGCETLWTGACDGVPGCLRIGVDGGVDGGPPPPPPPWCPSMPGECDPFARDCGSGLLCFVDPSLGTRCATVPSGAQDAGETCSATLRCGSGLDCLDTGSGPRCYSQCRPGSVGECPRDYKCVIDGYHPAGCVDYCAYFGPTCDPVRQDCSGFQQSCYVVRDPETEGPTTFCTRTGTTAVGSACSFAESCVEGASCLGGVCRQSCNTDGDCTLGGTCVDLTGSPYRYCR